LVSTGAGTDIDREHAFCSIAVHSCGEDYAEMGDRAGLVAASSLMLRSTMVFMSIFFPLT
jgi:hypothetical protein